mgnify:CR=1 FL=1|jgi:hypothetical protein
MAETPTWTIMHKIEPTFDTGFVTLSDYKKVATVKFCNERMGLSNLFRLTNSVDEYWAEEFCNAEYHDEWIMTVFADRCRSSSVGDLFCNGTTIYEIAGIGFIEHPMPE